MSVQRNFEQYHNSIVRSLQCKKDYIRNLIGEAHWLTDGEHKEFILRDELRIRVPDSDSIARGFVCSGTDQTSQIDIMICGISSPVLYRNGDFRIVTPTSVRAIIEVKTSVNSISDFRDATLKLSDNIGFIRSNGNPDCWAGLFSYDKGVSSNHDRQLLEVVFDAAKNDANRVINCVSLGPSTFVRFWESPEDELNGSPSHKCSWHLYPKLNLAQAYFLSNVVAAITTIPPEDKLMWFPLADGKVTRRTHWNSLTEKRVSAFQ